MREGTMRHTSRVGAALTAVAALTALTLPGAAHAAPAGDQPPAPAAKPAPPPTGQLKICNATGYLFDVYADGPSIRTDDLAGYLQECTKWDPVLTGRYD